jgi:hypothetical protein
VEEAEMLRQELRHGCVASEVFVWCAPHERGEDAEQAVRDLLAAPPPPLIGTSHADWIFEREGRSIDGGLAHLDHIDAEVARVLLARAIQFDLAYRVEVVDAATAARLASRVIAALPEPVRWWTNGTLALSDGDGSWTELTDATFDTGVIGVSRDRVLVVWFMAED